MIDVTCYNCDSDESEFYAEENGYTLVRCPSCGLLYVNPRPDQHEIDQAHQCGVHQGESELDVNRGFSPLQYESYLGKLRDLFGPELAQRESRWLDIGCGCGELLAALQQISNGRVRATGLEPNRNKRRTARERGLEVRTFAIEDHDQRYDFISLLNVYSHLPSPPDFLARCRDLLRPGGELLLETGDTAHLPPEEHYRPFQLPDHISFASETILVSLLQRCGFDVRTVLTYPAFPFRHSLVRVALEGVKLLVPGLPSRFRTILRDHRKSRRYITDMYIRAVLRPDS